MFKLFIVFTYCVVCFACKVELQGGAGLKNAVIGSVIIIIQIITKVFIKYHSGGIRAPLIRVICLQGNNLGANGILEFKFDNMNIGIVL